MTMKCFQGRRKMLEVQGGKIIRKNTTLSEGNNMVMSSFLLTLKEVSPF